MEEQLAPIREEVQINYIYTREPAKVGRKIKEILESNENITWLAIDITMDEEESKIFQQALLILRTPEMYKSLGINDFSILDCYLLAKRKSRNKQIVKDIINPETGEVTPEVLIESFDIIKVRSENRTQLKKDKEGEKEPNAIPTPLGVVRHVSEQLEGVNLSGLNIQYLISDTEDANLVKSASDYEKEAYDTLYTKILYKDKTRPTFQDALRAYKNSIIQYSRYFNFKSLQLKSLYSDILVKNYSNSEVIVSSPLEVATIVDHAINFPALDEDAQPIVNGPFFDLINEIITSINQYQDNILEVIASIPENRWIESLIKHFIYHAVKSSHPQLLHTEIRKITDNVYLSILNKNLVDELIENFNNSNKTKGKPKTFLQIFESLGDQYRLTAFVEQWLQTES